MTRMHLRREMEEADSMEAKTSKPPSQSAGSKEKSVDLVNDAIVEDLSMHLSRSPSNLNQKAPVGSGNGAEIAMHAEEHRLKDSEFLLPETFEDAKDFVPAANDISKAARGKLFKEEDEMSDFGDALAGMFKETSSGGANEAAIESIPETQVEANRQDEKQFEEEFGVEDTLNFTFVIDDDQPASFERAFDPQNQTIMDLQSRRIKFATILRELTEYDFLICTCNQYALPSILIRM